MRSPGCVFRQLGAAQGKLQLSEREKGP